MIANYPGPDHRQVKLVHNGETIKVDYKIAGLIKDLWAAGIKTYFSCQGHCKPYYNQAYVVMDACQAAKLLVSDLIMDRQPSPGRMYFHNEWRVEYGYSNERKEFFIILRFPQKDIPIIRQVVRTVRSELWILELVPHH